MSSASSSGQDPRANEVLALIGEHMPTNSSSPLASYLPGFTSLRLMLMKANRTTREAEILGTLLESYSSYVSSGKQTSEIAWLLARDCMHLSQQVMTQPQAIPPQPAALQGQAMNSFAAAPPPPHVQANGSNALNPASAPVQSTQGIQGMALHSAQRLHPAQQQSSVAQAQPFEGVPPAAASQQQKGQHASNGTFGMT